MTLLENIYNFIKSSRNYRTYDMHLNIVDKVFNHGRGALQFIRFYEKEKTIVINEILFTKRDKAKLEKFCKEAGIEDYTWKYARLGYPDWYFKNLSLSMC